MRDGPCGSPRVWLAIEPGYDPTRGFNNKLVIDRTNTRTYISSLEYSPHFSLHPLFMDLLSIAVIRKSHLVILIHPVPVPSTLQPRGKIFVLRARCRPSTERSGALSATSPSPRRSGTHTPYWIARQSGPVISRTFRRPPASSDRVWIV
jgi:hypothetical protein